MEKEIKMVAAIAEVYNYKKYYPKSTREEIMQHIADVLVNERETSLTKILQIAIASRTIEFQEKNPTVKDKQAIVEIMNEFPAIIEEITTTNDLTQYSPVDQEEVLQEEAAQLEPNVNLLENEESTYSKNSVNRFDNRNVPKQEIDYTHKNKLTDKGNISMQLREHNELAAQRIANRVAQREARRDARMTPYPELSRNRERSGAQYSHKAQIEERQTWKKVEARDVRHTNTSTSRPEWKKIEKESTLRSAPKEIQLESISPSKKTIELKGSLSKHEAPGELAKLHFEKNILKKKER